MAKTGAGGARDDMKAAFASSFAANETVQAANDDARMPGDAAAPVTPVRSVARDEISRIIRNDMLGADEWKRSKLGWALGASVFYKAGRAAVGMVTDPVTVTWSAAKGFFSYQTAEPLPTQSVDRAERFEVAKAFYNRDDADLALDVDATSKWFSIYFVMLALLFGYGLASLPYVGQGVMPVWAELLTKIALLPAVFALAAQMGFQNWQLRTRKLGTFRDYAMAPGAWLAEPSNNGGSGSGRSRGMSRIAMVLLVAGAAAFGGWTGSGSAVAQGAAPAGSPVSDINRILTTPDGKDLWKSMLNYMFPGLGPLDGDPSTGIGGANNGNNGLTSTQEGPQVRAIQGAFTAFLSVLMALSSAGLAYFTLVGAISTAHEGKVMGQRWHTFYAPVRVVTGFGMLVPVVKGYCLAQVLVIYMAVWGGAFGNLIWAGYVDTLGTQQPIAGLEPLTTPALKGVFILEVCREAALAQVSYQRVGQTQGGSTLLRLRNSVPANEADLKFTQNGAMSTFLNRGLGNVTYNRVNFTANYQSCGTIDIQSTISGAPNLTAYDNAVMRATENYASAMRPLAKSLVSRASAMSNGTAGATPLTEIDMAPGQEAVRNFNKAISDAKITLQNLSVGPNGNSGELATGMTKIKEDMKKWGWASSGSFYMSVSNFYGNYVIDSSRLPTVSNGSNLSDYMLSRDTNPIRELVNNTENFWKNLMGSAPDLSPATVGLSRSGATTDSVGDGSKAIGEILLAPKLRWAIGLLQVDLTKGSGMDHMVRFGHALLTIWGIAVTLIVAASTFITAVAAGAAAAGAAGAVGGIMGNQIVKAIFAYLGGMIQFFLVGLLAVGIVHAYVLPMLPYMMMFVFITGMLILVVEGMVAAPLWAFFHIRPDGQEFIEQVQRPGYMIMFNLILRIPLAMFGMFFSYLMIDTLLWFESVTFLPAFLGGTATDDSYGVFGILTAMVMFAFLHFQICMRSFSLITHLPDNVARWFGGQGERLGDDSHHNNFVGGIVGKVESKVGNVAGGSLIPRPQDRAPPGKKGLSGDAGAEQTAAPASSPGGSTPTTTTNRPAVTGGGKTNDK